MQLLGHGAPHPGRVLDRNKDRHEELLGEDLDGFGLGGGERSASSAAGVVRFGHCSSRCLSERAGFLFLAFAPSRRAREGSCEPLAGSESEKGREREMGEEKEFLFFLNDLMASGRRRKKRK